MPCCSAISPDSLFHLIRSMLLMATKKKHPPLCASAKMAKAPKTDKTLAEDGTFSLSFSSWLATQFGRVIETGRARSLSA